MELLKEILTELVSLPHRGATTPQEKRAAAFIEKRLKEFGYRVRIDPFQSPSTYSWEIVIFALMVALGLFIASGEPYLGAILCALGLWSFVRYFDGRDTVVGKWVPKKPSQNVVGLMDDIGHPADSTGQGRRNVVYLMAHYDTARASHLYHPALVKNFRQSFLMNAAVVFVSPVVAFLGAWSGETIWYRIVTTVLAVYVSVSILILLHREFFHSHVNGANDNGSGVTALLALARRFAENPLQNTRVNVLATGCEEEGMYGARSFVNQHMGNASLQHAYVLNFDNVGAGDLYYCMGEGMLGFHHYDPTLVSIAETIAQNRFPDVKPLRYTQAYFDSLVFVHHQIKTISFVALNHDGVIPHWHWYSDRLENIEWSTIQKAVDVGAAVVEEIDRWETLETEKLKLENESNT